MEIKETTDKWVEEAQSKLAKASGSTVINGFCRSVTAVLKRYCDATIVLLDNDFRLPVMAQLRIMSELVIKFLWCLEGKTSGKVEEQIKRWDLASLSQERRLYEKLVETSNDKLKNFAEERIEYLNKLSKDKCLEHLKSMPWGTIDLLLDISDVFKQDKYYVYVSRFAQFHHAVHINTFVLTESVKTERDSFEFTGDIDTNTDNLKGCCLGFVYMFLKKIYDFYKWNFDEIEKECQVICKQSNNTKT